MEHIKFNQCILFLQVILLQITIQDFNLLASEFGI